MSESDVYRRQILTYKARPRTERVDKLDIGNTLYLDIV